MSNPDPPHKIGDGKSPTHGLIDSPDADSFKKQVANGDEKDEKETKAHEKTDHPALGGLKM
jgi:hypothetical protein